MRNFLSYAISFFIFLGVFVTQALFAVNYFLILLTLFIIALPLGRWLARRITSVDPLLLLFR
jgi:hypothetical protein